MIVGLSDSINVHQQPPHSSTSINLAPTMRKPSSDPLVMPGDCSKMRERTADQMVTEA